MSNKGVPPAGNRSTVPISHNVVLLVKSHKMRAATKKESVHKYGGPSVMMGLLFLSG